MSNLYLELYSFSDNVAQVPVKTAVCLFNFMYLNPSQNINLYFVLTQPSKPFLDINLKSFNYQLLSCDQLQPPVSYCYLPIFTPASGSCCVAGLCAVLRQVVKASDETWRHLLGFREGCLFACAEVSLWTKYCEVDIIQTAEMLLSNVSPSTAEPCIPENIIRFEEHLKQPVRAHNVGKFIEENKVTYIEHKFAEGYRMSLADLIILPCMKVFMQLLGSIFLSQYIPLTIKWYKHMCDEEKISAALGVIHNVVTNLPSSLSITYIVPNVPKQSLYKSDPSRYKPRSKIFTKQYDVESALSLVNGISTACDYDTHPFGFEVTLDWFDIPTEIQPSVPSSRLARKRQQLENLTKPVIKIAKPGDIIVDFCCGSGHLGIILAYCLPRCRVVLLDNKEESLARAIQKVEQLELSNISIIQCNLDYFKGSFQIGVSLHACGVASDLVLNTCIKQNAVFVVCPCCYGSLQNNHVLSYPRSQLVRETLLDIHGYLVLGHCADQTHKDEYSKSEQGEKCMAFVDIDRCMQAKEEGYTVSLAKLVPPSCSPKNNLLVGIPQSL